LTQMRLPLDFSFVLEQYQAIVDNPKVKSQYNLHMNQYMIDV